MLNLKKEKFKKKFKTSWKQDKYTTWDNWQMKGKLNTK